MSGGSALLRAEVPGPGYHRRLISCQNACPVHTDARGYVRAIAEGRIEEAYLIARGPNPFASICGRICGAPCEAACRRGKIPQLDDDGSYVADDLPISIRALKRFACERCGVDGRRPEAVWEAVRSHLPEAGADAEELAALLRASTRAGFVPADGEKVAIVEAGFVGYLCLKEARALAHGDEESAEIAATARLCFIAGHLGQFAEGWANRISATGVPHLSAAARIIVERRGGAPDHALAKAGANEKGDPK